MGSNSYISIPSSLKFCMCSLSNGLLLESLPKPSNSALTSTPSFTFCLNMSKSSDAIESFRKLKYSRCTLLLACLMALNMSLNLSLPVVRSVILLLCVNVIPFFSNISTIIESLVCEFAMLQ